VEAVPPAPKTSNPVCSSSGYPIPLRALVTACRGRGPSAAGRTVPARSAESSLRRRRSQPRDAAVQSLSEFMDRGCGTPFEQAAPARARRRVLVTRLRSARSCGRCSSAFRSQDDRAVAGGNPPAGAGLENGRQWSRLAAKSRRRRRDFFRHRAKWFVGEAKWGGWFWSLTFYAFKLIEIIT